MAIASIIVKSICLPYSLFKVHGCNAIIVEGMMYGVGKTKQPLLYNVTCMWLVRIVGTFLCIHWLDMGLVSAWACMIAHNMVLFVLYMLTYIRGSWNPLREITERTEMR